MYFHPRLFTRWLPLLLAAVLLAWLFIPRQPDPFGFDPDRLGQLETAMWKAYYAENYPLLTCLLWRTIYSQFGTSPWHSAQIAWHAGHAARTFRQSRNREQAQQALPHLNAYYALLARLTDAPYDPERAAELELEWWQIRREHASAEAITDVLAELYSVTYQQPLEQFVTPAQLRVHAMQFRDQHRTSGMEEKHWDTLQPMLQQAYQSLKDSLPSSNDT